MINQTVPFLKKQKKSWGLGCLSFPKETPLTHLTASPHVSLGRAYSHQPQWSWSGRNCHRQSALSSWLWYKEYFLKCSCKVASTEISFSPAQFSIAWQVPLHSLQPPGRMLGRHMDLSSSWGTETRARTPPVADECKCDLGFGVWFDCRFLSCTASEEAKRAVMAQRQSYVKEESRESFLTAMLWQLA